ncbi:hypothetical protein M231_04967 [Tremella mesenterica]|uniref:Uncharacterized protein n=1 Tax=Tremella mesenterica TaxID=5217 RepID=A0A4Q1BJ55_TREME|nr:hypothetical protein M231_04967 [Tremella mesenterica]
MQSSHVPIVISDEDSDPEISILPIPVLPRYRPFTGLPSTIRSEGLVSRSSSKGRTSLARISTIDLDSSDDEIPSVLDIISQRVVKSTHSTKPPLFADLLDSTETSSLLTKTAEAPPSRKVSLGSGTIPTTSYVNIIMEMENLGESSRSSKRLSPSKTIISSKVTRMIEMDDLEGIIDLDDLAGITDLTTRSTSHGDLTEKKHEHRKKRKSGEAERAILDLDDLVNEDLQTDGRSAGAPKKKRRSGHGAEKESSVDDVGRSEKEGGGKKGKQKEVEETRSVTIDGDEDDTGEKRKLSKEEKEALKMKERMEREAFKEKEKKEKEMAKAAAKAAKEAEKSFQKKLADANRLRTSKRDTVREVHLYLSSDLALPTSPIAGALPEIRARLTENNSALHTLSEENSPAPGIVRFKRHVTSSYDHTAKRFVPLDIPRWEWETTTLIIVTAETIVDRLPPLSSMQGTAEILTGDSLVDWISDMRLCLGMDMTHQLFLVIKDLWKYCAKTKTLANREFTAAARAGLEGGSRDGNGPGDWKGRPSKERIEMELLKLQLSQKCFVVHVEKTEDIEDWIFNLACDIAIRPYKLISKSHLNFCPPDGIRKSSEPVGILELMLQQVQGITPSAAAGIAVEYPTFRHLMRAYDRAERKGMSEAEGLLKDCEVRNLKNGTANGRTLKGALSKRVYSVLRGEDSLALV